MQARPAKKSGVPTMVIALIVIGVLSVPCIGIVSAIAIPAFLGYLARSKAAEAEANLRTLYVGAAAYYADEHLGPDGTVHTRCTVDSATTPNVPGPQKTLLGALSPSFEALGFAPLDPVYYRYEIVSVGGCDHPEGSALYSFRAHGDLDGDGVQSLFELSAGSGLDGELARSTAIHRQDERE